MPRQYGIRAERYSLIHYPVSDEWELFDLEKDPQQMRSRYGDPAYAATVKELKAKLHDFEDSYQHIRDTYAKLCDHQGRGKRSIDGTVPRFELYDIANDPNETKDVAAEHPDVVEALKTQYNAWFDDVWARQHPKQPK